MDKVKNTQKKVKAKKCKGSRSDGGRCTKMTTIRGGYCSYHLDQKPSRKTKENEIRSIRTFTKKEEANKEVKEEKKIKIEKKEEPKVYRKVKDDLKISKFMEKMKPCYQEVFIEYNEDSNIEYKLYGLKINVGWVKEGYVDISDMMIILGNMMIEGLCYVILTSIDMKSTFGYRREITDGLLKREYEILGNLKYESDDNHFLGYATKYLLEDRGGIKEIMDKINEEIGKKYLLTKDAQKTLIKYMLYYYNKTLYIESPKELFIKLSEIIPLEEDQLKKIKQYMYKLLLI